MKIYLKFIKRNLSKLIMNCYYTRAFIFYILIIWLFMPNLYSNDKVIVKKEYYEKLDGEKKVLLCEAKYEDEIFLKEYVAYYFSGKVFQKFIVDRKNKVARKTTYNELGDRIGEVTYTGLINPHNIDADHGGLRIKSGIYIDANFKSDSIEFTRLERYENYELDGPAYSFYYKDGIAFIDHYSNYVKGVKEGFYFSESFNKENVKKSFYMFYHQGEDLNLFFTTKANRFLSFLKNRSDGKKNNIGVSFHIDEVHSSIMEICLDLPKKESYIFIFDGKNVITEYSKGDDLIYKTNVMLDVEKILKTDWNKHSIYEKLK